MRGIWRQEEKEKSSFLPDRTQLLNFMISMNSSIVKYDEGVFAHIERECIKKADHLVCSDTLHNCETLIMILSVDHSEDVESCTPLGWDIYILFRQLPTVWNVSFSTNVALISIVEAIRP